MSGDVKEAVESIETRVVSSYLTDTDHKFILAFAIIVAYAIILLIPVITNNMEMFETVAATVSGFVGTIIGYYFGGKT